MHICLSDLSIIGSDSGLSPGRRQAITWFNVGILLIRHSGTNFSEILTEILTFSFKKTHLKMSSGKCQPFCLDLNVVMNLRQHDGVMTWKHFLYYWPSLWWIHQSIVVSSHEMIALQRFMFLFLLTWITCRTKRLIILFTQNIILCHKSYRILSFLFYGF